MAAVAKLRGHAHLEHGDPRAAAAQLTRPEPWQTTPDSISFQDLGVVGLVFLAGHNRHRGCTLRAPGTARKAVALGGDGPRRRSLPKGSAMHAEGPQDTIDFTTQTVRSVRFITDSVGSKPSNVGDNVEVLYNPTAPKDALVRGGERIAAYILGIGGLLLAIVGLLMALSALDPALR